MNKIRQFWWFLRKKEPIATIRDIYASIKSVFKWLPVIWKDRNWDYVFILIILRHKLKMMRDFFNNDAMYVGCEKDAKDMDLCIKLMDRLIEDDYLMNLFKYHDEKWGDLDMKFIPVEDGSGNSRVSFSVPNAQTERDKNIEEKQRFLLYKKEGKQRQQDLDLLTKMLNKHLFKWWD